MSNNTNNIPKNKNEIIGRKIESNCVVLNNKPI